jgi:hypothetical protein
MARRIGAVLACLSAGALLSGCVGPDGPKAEALLHEATVAQQAVGSERFVLRYDIEAGGLSVTMAMQGGGYLKGRHAGDFVTAMSGSGVPGLSGLDLTLARRGDVVAIRENGRTEHLSVAAAERRFGSPTGMLDITRYVKSVSVDETQLDGRPADRIVGTLDTRALLGSGGGVMTELLSSAGVRLGDIRAVLVVPRDTHLVEVMLADLDFSAQGKHVHVHLSLATSGFDEPVAIPRF